MIREGNLTEPLFYPQWVDLDVCYSIDAGSALLNIEYLPNTCVSSVGSILSWVLQRMAIYSAPNALSSIERHFQFHRRKYDSSRALEEFQFRPSSPPRGRARALNRRNGRHSKFRTRNYLRGHYHPLSPPWQRVARRSFCQKCINPKVVDTSFRLYLGLLFGWNYKPLYFSLC